MCLYPGTPSIYPVIFTDIFIKSSMTFSPIYISIIALSQPSPTMHCNGMKCFEKFKLIYLST